MKTRFHKLSRFVYSATALAFMATALLPAFANDVFAYGQVTTRSIEMSNSTPGATGVTYLVGFTETAATVVKSVDIDFCSESPLYGSTCTAPTGLSGSSATLSAQSGTSGWTLTQGAAHLVVSGASANSAAAMTFTIGNMTNPSATPGATFYARIYTYAAQSNDYSSVTAPGTVYDFGGIALSTVTQVQITANVMEQLTFCAAKIAITGTCGNLAGNDPSVTIGHGGTTKVIDTSAVDLGLVYTQLSTNASGAGGTVVRMKASNTCANGGLSKSGGTTCEIQGVNGGSGTHLAITAGTAAFGACINKGTNTTVAAAYSDTVDSCPTTYNATALFGMDGTAATSTYGSQLFSVSGPVNQEANTVVFGATASNTTPAGIYTANESLIATGTF